MDVICSTCNAVLAIVVGDAEGFEVACSPCLCIMKVIDGVVVKTGDLILPPTYPPEGI